MFMLNVFDITLKDGGKAFKREQVLYMKHYFVKEKLSY